MRRIPFDSAHFTAGIRGKAGKRRKENECDMSESGDDEREDRVKTGISMILQPFGEPGPALLSLHEVSVSPSSRFPFYPQIIMTNDSGASDS